VRYTYRTSLDNQGNDDCLALIIEKHNSMSAFLLPPAFLENKPPFPNKQEQHQVLGTDQSLSIDRSIKQSSSRQTNHSKDKRLAMRERRRSRRASQRYWRATSTNETPSVCWDGQIQIQIHVPRIQDTYGARPGSSPLCHHIPAASHDTKCHIPYHPDVTTPHFLPISASI
jgi:hypothetical protein